jgi:aminopeptidase N
MDLDVTVPEGLVCASNGTLAGSDTAGGKTTWRWRLDSPVSNYAVALNVAPYEVLETSWKSVAGGEVPFVFYALPEDVAKARERLPELVNHVRFFERTLGPYPFRAEKYGVAQTPHLGMEHQTIIAYGYGFQHDAFGYDWLHHHEASHEWWGNLVTCADWKDMWIHEGFGTYMQGLYVEELHGREGLRKWAAQMRRGLGNRRPVAPRETRDSKEIYFDQSGVADNDIYSKGALVLHTLRWHMGDAGFREALRRFAYPDEAHRIATDGSQVRLVDTEDFRRVCEEVAEQDLGWFFEVYLRQPELPRLVTRWERTQGSDAGKLALRWEVPIDVPFPLEVDVITRLGGEDWRLRLAPGVGEETVYDVVTTEEPRADPDLWILRAP